MDIDWITVIAQIVNFLVLVALLRRFLYRPVLDAMARREARIAGQLRDAAERAREADARAREFQDKSDDIERRRRELLDQARADADSDRRRRLQEARDEVRQQREHWRAELADEWEDVRNAITRRLAGAATEATRRALADLADTDLQRAMIRVLRRRLADLDATERAPLAGDGPIEVATAFEPDSEMRAELSDAVHESLGRDVRFARVDRLVGGIELRTGEWKMSWTIDEYLRGLDEQVAQALAPGSRSGRAR